MFLPRIMHSFFSLYCRGGNKSLYQLLKILRLFPSPNLGWACGTVCPHSGAFWSTGGLGTTWWRHQMETFSALLALCVGKNSPHKGQWRGALMFSLICVWINGWVNNRETGDLRRHRGHYDVNVMYAEHLKMATKSLDSDTVCASIFLSKACIAT